MSNAVNPIIWDRNRLRLLDQRLLPAEGGDTEFANTATSYADLSDEQKMLAEQARGLLAERTPFDQLRKLIDSGAAGGYVRNAFDILAAIVALESMRRRCLVIGEDLALDSQRFHVTPHGVTLVTASMLAKL